MDFKEKVVQEAICYSSIYKDIFVNKEYLVFSSGFIENDFYILNAHENNYLHLIGVHTSLNPLAFFDKCINKTLTADDFDFSFKGKSPSAVKGSVRRKIHSLKNILSFFQNIIGIEEKFSKGNIYCAIAGSDNAITIGYTKVKKCIPMTLLKGNELSNKMVKCDLLLSKQREEDKYTDMIVGDKVILEYFLTKHPEIVFVSGKN